MVGNPKVMTAKMGGGVKIIVIKYGFIVFKMTSQVTLTHYKKN